MKEGQYYYVMWTYIGNHSETPTSVWATSAEEAGRKVLDGGHSDFKAKARVYVTKERPEIFTNRKD